jgi:hypothetical protein
MILHMVGPVEYFMSLDFFTFGWFEWVYLMAFLFIFSYLGIRGFAKEPKEKALLITGGTMFVALLTAMTHLPAFWSGIIIVFAFVAAKQYVLKFNNHDLIFSFFVLWVLLLLWSVVPVEFGYAFSIFALFYIYLMSEFDLRNKKKNMEDEKPKK